MKLRINKTLQRLIDDPKCLFVCNDSGGKDSRAMYLKIKDLVPPQRFAVIHADLGKVEWGGTHNYIQENISEDHLFLIVRSKRRLLDMVEQRGMFPSPKNRQCTSDLKRNPIQVAVRALCNAGGFDKVVNCVGLRAQESRCRKAKKVWSLNKGQTNSKRTWYEWLPIHKFTEKKVFETIEQAGQVPFWTYGAGMTRKSCVFCIMSCPKDLHTASKLRPELLEEYDALEKSTGRTMMMPTKKHGTRTLKQIIQDYEKANT